MADSFTQVAPDSTGDKIDASELTVGANTVNRQRIVLADDSAAAGLAKVTNAQPGATDYALAVRQTGDGDVKLNAQTWAATGVLWSGATDGFQSFQFQTTGTFTSTIVFEESNDNTNWTQVWYSIATTSLTAGVVTNLTNAQKGFGALKAKYFRVRVSAYTSSASGAFTLVLSRKAVVAELVYVAGISGSVTVQPTSPLSTAFGSTAFVKSAASTNATSVKASAGNIHGGVLVNNSAAVKFLKLYNKASAPTVGTDAPVAVLGIAANGGNINLSDNSWAFARFTTGIAYAITGAAADSDTTAVAANDVSGWILYA